MVEAMDVVVGVAIGTEVKVEVLNRMIEDEMIFVKDIAIATEKERISHVLDYSKGQGWKR